MTKFFAVHEIHDKNGVHLNEVFEPVAADLDTLKSLGAVREPSQEELAFYNLTKSTKDPVELEVKLKEHAEEARAAATAAAAKAAAKPNDAKLKTAAEEAAAAATAAEAAAGVQSDDLVG